MEKLVGIRNAAKQRNPIPERLRCNKNRHMGYQTEYKMVPLTTNSLETILPREGVILIVVLNAKHRYSMMGRKQKISYREYHLKSWITL